MSEFNPLVQRVDALLKRHQQQPAPVRPADPDMTLELRAYLDDPQLKATQVEPPLEVAPAAQMEEVPREPVLREPAPWEQAPQEPAPSEQVLQEPPLPVVEEDFPVLTEIVEPSALPGIDERNTALAARVEAAVLERVLPGLDLALDQRLGRTVSDLVEEAADGLRADLASSMRDIVREAVSEAVRAELEARSPRE